MHRPAECSLLRARDCRGNFQRALARRYESPAANAARICPASCAPSGSSDVIGAIVFLTGCEERVDGGWQLRVRREI